MTETIIYKYFDTQLGEMICGVYDEKVCLLEFHDRRSLPSIIDRKNAYYKTLMVEGDHPLIDEVDKQINEYFEGERIEFNIPLDIHGTPFQEQVWEQLLAIPYGKTRSYGEIAESLGKPTAFRAVGNANGSNNIAIIIPCHRVIGENGKLVGYGGGKHRKQKLLELEHKYSGYTETPLKAWF